MSRDELISPGIVQTRFDAIGNRRREDLFLLEFGDRFDRAALQQLRSELLNSALDAYRSALFTLPLIANA